MAQLSIVLNTTAAQDAKLAKVLERVNAQRVSLSTLGADIPPFASVEEWLKDFLVGHLRAFVQEQKRIEDAERQALIDAATAAQIAQIDAILRG